MMDYNIAIDPSRDICEKAYAHSAAIAPQGTFFILEEGRCLPHISLAHFTCTQEKASLIFQDVKTFLNTCHPFFLRSTKCVAYKNEWIFMEYAMTEELARIEKNLVLILGQHGSKKTSYAFSLLPPHLTLTRLLSATHAVKDMPEDDFSFMVQQVNLFERGEHGTAIRICEEYALS